MAEPPIDRITRELLHGKEAAARHPPSNDTAFDQIMRELLRGRQKAEGARDPHRRFGEERMIWPDRTQEEQPLDSSQAGQPHSAQEAALHPGKSLMELSPKTGKQQDENQPSTVSASHLPITDRNRQSERWGIMRELARDTAADPVAEIARQQTLKLEIVRQLARDATGSERERMSFAHLLLRDRASEQMTTLVQHQTQRLELLRDLVRDETQPAPREKSMERKEQEYER
ncbi:MAG: hypothetical protein R2867_02785 [Caldilineaceae bacterium]